MLSLVASSCAASRFPTLFAIAQQWTNNVPRNMVIVIEGLDGVGKSSVATRLVKMLGPGAQLHYALPEKMRESRADFDALDEIEKRQFYLLGNCVAMAEANAEYNVLDRSYASTLAYHRGTNVAQGLGDYEHSSSLTWPPHLKPHHYFYLSCEEPVRLARLSGRKTTELTEEEIRLAASDKMRNEIDWTYRNLEGVQVVDVTHLSQDAAAEALLLRIL